MLPTVGDADTLRAPRKSVDVAGCSPRPRGVGMVGHSPLSVGSLPQIECGDVKRKAGAHCALSACEVLPVSLWAK